MDTQTKLKAQLGDIQLRLEQLQAKANQLTEKKGNIMRAIFQEMNKPVKKPEEKPVKN